VEANSSNLNRKAWKMSEIKIVYIREFRVRFKHKEHFAGIRAGTFRACEVSLHNF